MEDANEAKILKYEERLRKAMLRSDVSALDQLLAPELIFTNHLGQVSTKKDDLESHYSGVLKVEALKPSEEHVLLMGEVAIVSVRVHLIGSYAGIRSDDDFRFTRAWAQSSGDTWRVVAAHSSLVT